MGLYYFITENDSKFFSLRIFKIGEDIRINWEILSKDTFPIMRRCSWWLRKLPRWFWYVPLLRTTPIAQHNLFIRQKTEGQGTVTFLSPRCYYCNRVERNLLTSILAIMRFHGISYVLYVFCNRYYYIF